MSCDYENLIPEFLTNSLDKDERETFVEHLGACQSCSATLHSFRNVDKVLQTMVRPEPDPQLLASYHASLEATFDNAGFFRQISNTVAEFWRSQRQPIRLARAGLVVAFGVFIGWFIFGSERDVPVTHSIQPAHGLRLAKQDMLLVQDFFAKTQSVLEGMVKMSQQELNREPKLDEQKKAAQELLMKTFVVHELALQLGNDSILDFLSRLELVLYEISNLTRGELGESLDAIQLLIRESGLLQEVEEFTHSA